MGKEIKTGCISALLLEMWLFEIINTLNYCIYSFSSAPLKITTLLCMFRWFQWFNEHIKTSFRFIIHILYSHCMSKINFLILLFCPQFGAITKSGSSECAWFLQTKFKNSIEPTLINVYVISSWLILKKLLSLFFFWWFYLNNTKIYQWHITFK